MLILNMKMPNIHEIAGKLPNKWFSKLRQESYKEWQVNSIPLTTLQKHVQPIAYDQKPHKLSNYQIESADLFFNIRAVGSHLPLELKINPYKIETIEPFPKTARVSHTENRLSSLRRENPWKTPARKRFSRTERTLPTQETFSSNRSLQICIRFQHNNYTVYDRILGKGSFSTVYLGLHEPTNTKVAVKEIKDYDSSEIGVLASIRSQYVINMLDYWEIRNKLYIVFELCEGTLKEQMAILSYEQKLRVFRQILQGMKYLHDRNIIHQDIKLDNILIKDGKVKICDFGLSRKISNKDEVASLSSRQGTPSTMAPEVFFNSQCSQIEQSFSSKCDIWSLGVVLHELIYKSHPFNCDVVEFKKNRRVKVRRLPQVEALLDRCLVVNPNERACIDELLWIVSRNSGPFKVLNLRKGSQLFQNSDSRQNQSTRSIRTDSNRDLIINCNYIPHQNSRPSKFINQKQQKSQTSSQLITDQNINDHQRPHYTSNSAKQQSPLQSQSIEYSHIIEEAGKYDLLQKIKLYLILIFVVLSVLVALLLM